MEMQEIKQQIEQWKSDRRFIAEQAYAEICSTADITPIIIERGNELLGIASLTEDGELLNLATKQRGVGSQMLEEIARYAIANDVIIETTAADSAIKFYLLAGFEIEGYPGDNCGVPAWWPEQQMHRYLNDRKNLRAEQADVWEEYAEECGI